MTRETTQPDSQAAGNTQTNLAVTRNILAAERTLMAWIRTSLSMISFGFSIAKIGDALASTKLNLGFRHDPNISGVAFVIAILLSLLGIFAFTDLVTRL